MELKILDNLIETRKVDAERRAVDAVMSTATLDRYQEIIEPRSFAKRMARFLSNPALLRDHDHQRQIGHWENVRITDDALVGTAIFAETDDAEEIWKLHRDGHRKAFSVGFIPHGWEARDIEVEGRKKRVRAYTDCELLECSSVAIPANPDALMRLVRGVPIGGDVDTFHRVLMEALGQFPLKNIDDLVKQLREKIVEDCCRLITDPFGPVQSELRDAIASALRRDPQGDPPRGVDKGDVHPVVRYLGGAS